MDNCETASQYIVLLVWRLPDIRLSWFLFLLFFFCAEAKVARVCVVKKMCIAYLLAYFMLYSFIHFAVQYVVFVCMRGVEVIFL